jgi:hypothetical protein
MIQCRSSIFVCVSIRFKIRFSVTLSVRSVAMFKVKATIRMRIGFGLRLMLRLVDGSCQISGQARFQNRF